MASFESITSTHQRYKNDTALFTTWLANAAKACGWKPTRKPEQPQEQQATPLTESKAPRLKGKARKLAKAANATPSPAPLSAPKQVKYVVSTQDLLKQVDLVSKSSKAVDAMPGKVLKALQAAISARERCAVWFEKTNFGTQTSRQGHRYFVDLLQKAKDTLHVSPASPAENFQGTKQAEKEDLSYMRNAFAALEVEDLLSDPEDVDVPVQTGQSHRSDTTTQVYELEVDRETELAFMVFSFFEDVHRLRADLGAIWKRYRNSELHLLQATVLTTAALELVRRMEEDAHSAILALGNPGSGLTTYQDLVATIYNAESLGRQDEPGLETSFTHIDVVNIQNPSKSDPTMPKPDYGRQPYDPKALEISPFDEFVFLPAGRMMTKLASMRYPVLKFAWPTPVAPMATNYIARPELLDDPRIQYFEKQERFIAQVFLDMVLDDSLRHPEEQGSPFPADLRAQLEGRILDFDDPVYAAFRPLWVTGAVTTATVFAAQITWDIYEICQTGPTVSKLLKDSAQGYRESFGWIELPGGGLDTKEVRWLTKDSGLVMTLYSRIDMHMKNPAFPMYKQVRLEAGGGAQGFELSDAPPEIRAAMEASWRAKGWTPPDNPQWEENLKKIGKKRTEGIKPNPDPAFLFEANKLHAGTVLLDVVSMAEEAGVSLANHHLSIFAMAHLYNALHKLAVFDVHWPEMDRIIDIHIGPIFASDIPTTPKEMLSRFAYRTGASTTNSRRFNEKMPWKITTTAATQAIRAFFSSKMTLPRLLHDLGSQAAIHDKTLAGVGPAKTSRSGDRRLQLTPRNTLAKLEQYFGAVWPDINIDYVPLTRQCNRFFKVLRAQLQRELGVDYPSIVGRPGDSNDRCPLAMAMGIFTEVREIEDRPKARKSREAGAENPYLKAPQLMVMKELLEMELKSLLRHEAYLPYR